MGVAIRYDPVLRFDERTRLVDDELLRLPEPRERTGRWRDARALDVHIALREVGAARHGVDVCLARLLRLMRDGRGYRRWGVTGLDAYLTEGLGQKSPRRFQYLIAIDEAIANGPLPRLGRAWRRGVVTVSQARELIRVITPDNERRWLALAGRVSVRRLARLVEEARQAGEPPAVAAGQPPATTGPDGETEHWRREVVAASRPVDAAWQVAVETSRRMAGYELAVYECVEDWTAEYASGCAIAPAPAPAAAADPRAGRDDAQARARADARWISREIDPACDDLRFLRKVGRDVRLAIDPLAGAQGRAALDPAELDRRIRWLLRLEGRLVWYECRLMGLMAGLRLHLRLGFASLALYAVEALGSSERRAWGLVRLAKDLEDLPKVAGALRHGRITALQAELICKVAKGSTQDAWVARARTVTLAALRQDVDFVLSTDDLPGLPPDRPLAEGRPPCAAPVAGARRAGPGRRGPFWIDRVQTCAARTSGAVAIPLARRVEGWYSAFGEDPRAVAREMLSDAGRKRPICFVAPAETSLQWALTLAHCRGAFGQDAAPTDSQVVAVLLLNFLGQWAAPQILKASRKHTTFTRDGWLCQLPGCRSRANLHAHHVVFRSRGGPDAAWNLVTVCAPHHRLIHAGIVGVNGRAPGGLQWAMGVNAEGDVRERFHNATRVDCQPGWLAGADAPGGGPDGLYSRSARRPTTSVVRVDFCTISEVRSSYMGS